MLSKGVKIIKQSQIDLVRTPIERYIVVLAIITIRVIESQLGLLIDVLECEEGKVMKRLVGDVGYNGKNPEIGITRVVDETCWA